MLLELFQIRQPLYSYKHWQHAVHALTADDDRHPREYKFSTCNNPPKANTSSDSTSLRIARKVRGIDIDNCIPNLMQKNNGSKTVVFFCIETLVSQPLLFTITYNAFSYKSLNSTVRTCPFFTTCSPAI